MEELNDWYWLYLVCFSASNISESGNIIKNLHHHKKVPESTVKKPISRKLYLLKTYMTPLLDTNNYQTLGNWVYFLLFKTNAHHSSSQYEKEEHVNRRLFQGVKLAWETRLVAKNSGITQLQVVAQSDTTKVRELFIES